MSQPVHLIPQFFPDIFTPNIEIWPVSGRRYSHVRISPIRGGVNDSDIVVFSPALSQAEHFFSESCF